ncbi:MAG: M14 family zinc carboxypeptidase [Planctomycetota bacterium]|nr:M14 family zinc carboxypeptidase [Planctomycetota bacterium]
MLVASIALLSALTVAQSTTPEGVVLKGHAPIRLGDDAANQWTEPFFPGASYDSSVARPEDFLGQPVGSRLASHDEMLRILRAIAASSDRVSMERYGQTYEGRPLVTLVITSPRNQARMDEIRATARRLWDPRGAGPTLASAIKGQPAVAWMGYGIHGDETSASEAALPVAYHLAACTDEEVASMLEETVVVLDPCLNPDGRERIRSMVLQSAGYRANLDGGAMQRGRWPNGRGNHYLFDMNRDWMAGEAPETRGRWARLLDLPPQLFVDAHEMSGLDTFLFYPQSAPRNAHLPERLLHWQGVLADDAARVFDRYGWGYYTREWADALYPGYSDAWGSLTGAIGMLYEQGRTIGAPLRRESGEIVSYRETVHGQVAASLANLKTFAANREEILRDYLAHREAACEPVAEPGKGAYLVVPSADVEVDARLMRALVSQGIEVFAASEAFEATEVTGPLGDPEPRRSFPAGTWIVPAAQPQGAMMRAYLEFDPRLDADFLQKERESIERGKGSKVYDVTAWCLGRQLGVEGYWASMPAVESALAGPVRALAGPAGDLAGAYAWVVNGDDRRSLRFAARAMELGLQVHVSDREFEARVRGAKGAPERRPMPRGSLLLRRHENPEGVDGLVRQAALESSAVVYAVVSGRAVEDGPDLGGGHFSLLEQPRVALLSNSPVSTTDFGHVWRYLDEDLGMPVTLVDAQRPGSVDFDEYNVFILPPGAGDFAREQAEELARWTRAGGCLITIGSSSLALADPELGLSANRLRRDVLEDLEEYAWRTERERGSMRVEVDVEDLYGSPAETTEGQPEVRVVAEEDSTEADEEEEVADAEEQDRWRRRFSPAGVILRAEVNPDSWLTVGVRQEEMAVLFSGSSVLMSSVRPAIRLAAEDRLRLGGLLWPEARGRIADSAWLTAEALGEGKVVAFAVSPVYRGSWRSTGRLLGNAVVLGQGAGD